MAFTLRSLSMKHIPTLLGMAVLTIGLISGIVFIRTSNTNSFLPRASPQTTPQNIKITNVTDTSFSVSFVTDSSAMGFVKYGTSGNNLSQTATDDRDQGGGQTNLYHNHHITVRSLKANTTYYFRLGTGTRELYDNNGSPYTITTAQAISAQSRTIYGQVVTQTGSPAGGALVYVNSDNLAPISTVVQSSGSWVISLAQARTTDLRNAATLGSDTVLNLLVLSPTDSATSVVTTKIAMSQPVPQITIGQNADFTSVATPTPFTGATPLPTDTPAPATLQSKFTSILLAPPTESTPSPTLNITYPTKDGDLVTSDTPELRGTAIPGNKITLTLKGKSTQTTTQTVDPSGVWTWTPITKLAKNSYTLTLASGTGSNKQTVVRTFNVDTTQAGIIPSLTASDSGTLATPVPTATPTATIAATATPTATKSAKVTHPSTASGELTTGSATPTLLLVSFGIMMLLVGTILWVLN